MHLFLFLACSMAGAWDSAGESDPVRDTAGDTGPADAPPSLLITELMKDPDAVDDDLGEWFEVMNVGDRSASLATLAVEDDDGDGFQVEAWTLAPGAVVVFGASADTGLNGGAPVQIAYDVERFKFGNEGGAVVLRYAGRSSTRWCTTAAFRMRRAPPSRSPRRCSRPMTTTSRRRGAPRRHPMAPAILARQASPTTPAAAGRPTSTRTTMAWPMTRTARPTTPTCSPAHARSRTTWTTTAMATSTSAPPAGRAHRHRDPQ